MAYFGNLSIDWQEYKDYIFSNLSRKYARDILRLSKKYFEVLKYPQRASKIAILTKDKKRGYFEDTLKASESRIENNENTENFIGLRNKT
ncbi:MAG: hypothetical protein QME50_05870 [Candidatus Bathyarchaeota archaeon]|nr:hypothetical protein [Candidatus Bathyarchaeota archaeon]